jgi:hypothetical protein
MPPLKNRIPALAEEITSRSANCSLIVGFGNAKR